MISLSIYRTLMLLARALLPLLSVFHSKVKATVAIRKKLDGTWPWLPGPLAPQPVWIHCASGEFEYAKPLIRLFKEKHADWPILVTYFSPSIQKAVQNFAGVDLSCPLPWDQPHLMRQFVHHHQPRALLIARTDTWPEMILSCYQNHIPILLFATTLVKSSGRTQPLLRFLSQFVFNKISTIHCVSENDAAELRHLGITSTVSVEGDTRYDQVQHRLLNPKPLSNFFDRAQPILVAGSTWPEDERVLLESLLPSIDYVLVPHEPSESHLQSLEKSLAAKGWNSVRYSRTQTWPPDSVLLVDQVGILAELYAHATWAFVGGSFRKTVHSVMEPLAAGCLTFVGPYFQNNREAAEFQKVQCPSGWPAVQSFQDATKLKEILQETISRISELQNDRSFLQKEIQKRSGSSAAALKWMENQV